jgi:hypothetical protein
MASKNIEVKCIVGRRVADDDYQLGQTYTLTKERYDRYPAFFTVIKEIKQDIVEPKQMAKTVQNKRVAITEDK